MQRGKYSNSHYQKRTIKYRPSDLFTQNDVLEIINTCDHPRDKALFAVLYEALRPHEALALKVGDIDFHENYATLTVPEDTKTGTRTIPIVFSFPYLRDWLNYHPFKKDSNAFLFVLTRGHITKPMSYMRLWDILNELKKRLNYKLNKRYWNPYIFRHSRLTMLAKKMKEQKLKLYAGWTPDSPMASIYVHLDGSDLVDDVLEYHGLATLEKPKEKPDLLECPRCKYINALDAKYCKCGYILSIEGFEEMKEKEELINGMINEQAKLIGSIQNKLNELDRKINDKI